MSGLHSLCAPDHQLRRGRALISFLSPLPRSLSLSLRCVLLAHTHTHALTHVCRLSMVVANILSNTRDRRNTATPGNRVCIQTSCFENLWWHVVFVNGAKLHVMRNHGSETFCVL